VEGYCPRVPNRSRIQLPYRRYATNTDRSLSTRFRRLTVCLRRGISRDDLISGTALIQQSLGVDVAPQIVVPDKHVLNGRWGKSRVGTPRSHLKNYSPRLRLVWLILETSVPRDLNVPCSVHEIYARPVRRLVLIGDIMTRIRDRVASNCCMDRIHN
jgi:hypothetical protein